MVKKYTGGWTAGTSGSGSYAYSDYITSYHRFGYIRMKHHIINSYNIYLLMRPSTKVYTTSLSNSWMNTYRTPNAYGTWSVNHIDTQVKINGYNGWQFVSLNAGNIMSAYSNNVFDPSEKVVEIQFTTSSAVLPYSSLSSTTTDCSL